MTTYSTSEPREAGYYMTSNGLWYRNPEGYWFDPEANYDDLISIPEFLWYFGPIPGEQQQALEVSIKIAFAEMWLAEGEASTPETRLRTGVLYEQFTSGTRTPQLLEELRRVTASLGQTSAPPAPPGPESA